MTHAGRRLAGGRLAVALIALLTALLAAPAHASPPIDAAVADLRADGVHVSWRALGVAAPAARARLQRARSDLAGRRRDVAFAIVPGPVGSPGMTALARRLHREADLVDVLLLVTGPGYPVAAWGVAPRAPVVAAVAASGANRLPNPVDRLQRAAEIAAPPRQEPDGVRELLVLLLLGGLGAAWAVAWGAHRTDRHERMLLTEARMHLRVWIDALRAHAMALSTGPRLPPRDLRAVEDVLAVCADTLGGVHAARTVADVDALAPRVAAGFATVGWLSGADASRPFEGLCATDPAHGRAVAGAGAGADGAPSLCRECARLAESGVPPSPRQVPVGPGLAAYTVVVAEGIGGRRGAGVAQPAPLNA